MNSPSVTQTTEFFEISLSDRRAAMSALAKARIDAHMTLLDASWNSGVSWDAVRSWVKGRREPTMGNLVAVAQTLGFEIILRRQEQTPSPALALVLPEPTKKRKRRDKQPDPNQITFLDRL